MKTHLQDHIKLLIAAPFLLAAIGFYVANRDIGLPLALAILGNQFVMSDGLSSVVRRVNAPARAMYERGYEMGERIGYRKGRRCARPVVIPLRRQDNAERNAQVSSS